MIKKCGHIVSFSLVYLLILFVGRLDVCNLEGALPYQTYQHSPHFIDPIDQLYDYTLNQRATLPQTHTIGRTTRTSDVSSLRFQSTSGFYHQSNSVAPHGTYARVNLCELYDNPPHYRTVDYYIFTLLRIRI